jgi:hypothetical protein
MLDSILANVNEAFKNGVPNGSLLGWDYERFWQNLIKLTEIGEVLNVTDFNYGFCNTYFYYYPSKKIKCYEMATFEISFVSDVFQIYWTKYSDYGKSGNVIESPENDESKEWEKRVRNFIQQKGFEECLTEWYNLPIEGVELELSGKDQVTLGKCLFVDYEE